MMAPRPPTVTTVAAVWSPVLGIAEPFFLLPWALSPAACPPGCRRSSHCRNLVARAALVAGVGIPEALNGQLELVIGRLELGVGSILITQDVLGVGNGIRQGLDRLVRLAPGVSLLRLLDQGLELLLSRILDRDHRGLLERAAGALERPERLVDLVLRGVLIAQDGRGRSPGRSRAPSRRPRCSHRP